MSDLLKIILTSSLTIIGGVVVFTLSQILALFIIQPIHELRKHIGVIADTLIFRANIYANPGVAPFEVQSETANALRQAATLLQSKAHMVPMYDRLAEMKWVPKWPDIQMASGRLIFISNNLGRQVGNDVGNPGMQNADAADVIKKSLGLRIS